MKRPRKVRVTTKVGTEVKVTFEEADPEHIRILTYFRRPPGHPNFRRAPEWEGQVVPKRSFPHE